VTEEVASDDVKETEKTCQNEQQDEIILPHHLVRIRKLVTVALVIISGPVPGEEKGQVLHERIIGGKRFDITHFFKTFCLLLFDAHFLLSNTMCFVLGHKRGTTTMGFREGCLLLRNKHQIVGLVMVPSDTSWL
jgi:hypothetical protein